LECDREQRTAGDHLQVLLDGIWLYVMDEPHRSWSVATVGECEIHVEGLRLFYHERIA
jgi:hypothetical protein